MAMCQKPKTKQNRTVVLTSRNYREQVLRGVSGSAYDAGQTDEWQTTRLAGAGAQITRGSTSYFSVLLCRFEIFQIKIFKDRCCLTMSPKIFLKLFKLYFLYLSF